MNMPKIPIKTLVPVNAALAALLGLCLSLGIVGKMAAFPVEPGSQALLRLLGLLLFGMSVSLWVPTDLHMRDSRRRIPELVAVALVLAWLPLPLALRGYEGAARIISWSIPLSFLIIVWSVFYSMTTRRSRRDPVERSAAQQERNRLARDLHDSIKQQIFSIKLSSAAAEERWERDPGAARAALADVRRSAHAAMVEMQAMLSQLRPEPLATVGLVEALREQCEALGYRSGIPVHFEIGDLPPDKRLPASAREHLFRIAQEALSNIAQHARARSVSVQLGQVEQDGDPALLLRLRDDGQGFDPASRSTGMGLRNLRERLEALHGTLEIQSAPGQGTEIRACVPLRSQDISVTGGPGMTDFPIWFVVVALLLPGARRPEVLFPLLMLYMAARATVRTRKAISTMESGSARALRLRLSRHQYVFHALALLFWWTCLLVPEHATGVQSQLFRVVEFSFNWLARVLRIASPLFLGLALWEAWSYFRLRRSPGAPARESGPPAWLSASMLLGLLASLPFVLFSRPVWLPGVGFLFYVTLVLGWVLRRAS